jgi:hypothetical protein
LKILKKNGYEIRIDYVMKNDVFNEKMELKESKLSYSYVFEKKNYNLMTNCPLLNEKSDTISQEAKNKFDNEFNFAIALIEKDGNTELIKISKNEVYASLTASLDKKTCYKERIGLKAMIDIAVIHILYNRYINNSYSSEDDEYISKYEENKNFNKNDILSKNIKSVAYEKKEVEEKESKKEEVSDKDVEDIVFEKIVKPINKKIKEDNLKEYDYVSKDDDNYYRIIDAICDGFEDNEIIEHLIDEKYVNQQIDYFYNEFYGEILESKKEEKIEDEIDEYLENYDKKILDN